MPTYPVINKETGEKKELSMTMVKYDEWRKENPDWDKDWNAGVAGLGEVGEWKDKLITKILAGMMFYTRHPNPLALEFLKLTSNGKKKRFSYRCRNDG